MILAGDVGGTKVDLALYDFTQGKLKSTREKVYRAKEYSGLEVIVKDFLGSQTATAACFGVPGPVRDGRLRLTNLPWTLDSRELSAGPASSMSSLSTTFRPTDTASPSWPTVRSIPSTRVT